MMGKETLWKNIMNGSYTNNFTTEKKELPLKLQ